MPELRRRVDENSDVIDFYDLHGLTDLAPVTLDRDAVVLSIPSGLRNAIGLVDADSMSMSASEGRAISSDTTEFAWLFENAARFGH